MSDNTNPPQALRAEDRLAIVVSRFNLELTTDLLQGAQTKLRHEGLSDGQIDVVWVPGAWEIPLAAQQLAQSKRYAAIIALGVVIQGQTTHDRQINRFVSLSIGKLSLQYQVPIAFGVLTCKSLKQALRRADPLGRNKGGEAAAAAVDMIRALRLMHQDAL